MVVWSSEPGNSDFSDLDEFTCSVFTYMSLRRYLSELVSLLLRGVTFSLPGGWVNMHRNSSKNDLFWRYLDSSGLEGSET